MNFPSKILWKIDLSTSESSLWSSKLWHRLNGPEYSVLSFEWLKSHEIERMFLPEYRRLIMSRSDFRLDPEKTVEKLKKMSKNESYRLFWVRYQGDVMGGVVIRLLDKEAKIAYRAFDHELAHKNGMKELDYYVERKLRDELREMKYESLSHGSDKHPVTQIGLSIFKMRIGATPSVKRKVEDVVWQDGVHIGYYSEPIEGRYSQFNLRRPVRADLLHEFTKLAERVGVRVVAEYDG